MKNWIARLADWTALNELTRTERRLLAAGGVATGCLLLALASTCQESVQRGERLRAEQRMGSTVEVVIEVASAERFGR